MSRREPANAWMYEKYSIDVEKARRELELIISEDSPRYIRGSPDRLYEITQRIVKNKLQRAEAYKIDSYFDL